MTTEALNPVSPEDQAVIDRQVTSWRKEIARLQDLVAHATGSQLPGTLMDRLSRLAEYADAHGHAYIASELDFIGKELVSQREIPVVDEAAIERVLLEYFEGSPYPKVQASGALMAIRPYLRASKREAQPAGKISIDKTALDLSLERTMHDATKAELAATKQAYEALLTPPERESGSVVAAAKEMVEAHRRFHKAYMSGRSFRSDEIRLAVNQLCQKRAFLDMAIDDFEDDTTKIEGGQS